MMENVYQTKYWYNHLNCVSKPSIILYGSMNCVIFSIITVNIRATSLYIFTYKFFKVHTKQYGNGSRLNLSSSMRKEITGFFVHLWIDYFILFVWK